MACRRALTYGVVVRGTLRVQCCVSLCWSSQVLAGWLAMRGNVCRNMSRVVSVKLKFVLLFYCRWPWKKKKKSREGRYYSRTTTCLLCHLTTIASLLLIVIARCWAKILLFLVFVCLFPAALDEFHEYYKNTTR